MKEELIMAFYQTGDLALFEQLETQYRRRLHFTFVQRGCTWEEAEELTQDMFLGLIDLQKPAFDPEQESFRSILTEDSTVTEHPEPGPCLSVSRAQALVFDGERRTSGETAHLADCPVCQRVLERVRLQTIHPNLLFLLRDVLGILTPEEQRVLRFHLGGGCRHCSARRQFLAGRRPWAASVAVPARFPADEERGPAEEGVSPNGQVTVELLDEADGPVLEVRTQEAGLAEQLLGYTLAGSDGRPLIEGMALLRAEREGWRVARLPLSTDALAGLQGRNGLAVVCPLPASSLDAEELPILNAARFRDQSDAQAGQRWRTWAETVHLPDGLEVQTEQELDPDQ
jgi:hypothetical protein